VSVSVPIVTQSSSYLAKMRLAISSAPGRRIISIRSWLSESMIS
jgi:hypothetical protein